MRRDLIRVSDIPATGTACAYLLGREVLVTRSNGKPRAFINVCMDHGGPLALEEDRFTYQWDGSQYDSRTEDHALGPLRPDARLNMPRIRVEGETLVHLRRQEQRGANGVGRCRARLPGRVESDTLSK